MHIKRFLQAEHGVTAIEYALLGGLIAVVIVSTVAIAGNKLLSLYTYIKDQVVAAKS